MVPQLEGIFFGFRPDVPDWGEMGWLEVAPPRFSASGFVQPSLLLPTLFKQEININYQTDPRARHYKTLWEIFAARLASATALLTVGCSFPDTDWHSRVVVGSGRQCWETATNRGLREGRHWTHRPTEEGRAQNRRARGYRRA